MADKFRISELVYLRLRDKISPMEELELQAWMDESEANKEFVEKRMDREGVALGIQTFLAMDEDALRKKFDERCLKAGIKPASKVISLPWKKSVAVILFLVASGGVYLWHLRSDKSIYPDVEVAKRASLIVHDGDTVYLDEVQRKGEVVVDGWRISITDSQQIAYEPARNLSEENEKIYYHTFNNPYGQKWKVTLPDQSSMELYAGSSLTFPVKARPTEKNDRNVRLSGEAYFKVTPNPQSPFIVSADDAQFEAISTAFDVNQKGRKLKVQVIEGAIIARKGNKDCKVNEGYAAEIGSSADDSWKITPCDSPGISWRADFFDLSRLNLRESMEQLSSWYGKEVEILPGVDTVSRGILSAGRIKKAPKVEQLLPHLGVGHKIHLYTDGQKIIASP